MTAKCVEDHLIELIVKTNDLSDLNDRKEGVLVRDLKPIEDHLLQTSGEVAIMPDLRIGEITHHKGTADLLVLVEKADEILMDLLMVAPAVQNQNFSIKRSLESHPQKGNSKP